VWISRSRERSRFPCRVALVAANNPCPWPPPGGALPLGGFFFRRPAAGLPLRAKPQAALLVKACLGPCSIGSTCRW